jgi:cysteinyl-tRNA synthetase
LDNFDVVLGLGLRDWQPVAFDVPGDIRALLDEREHARAARNWAEADRLRDTLSARGWRVEDSKEGQRVIEITIKTVGAANASEAKSK